MSLTYKMNIKITPPQIRRGASNELTVTFTDTNADITYCAGKVKGYNMTKKLQPVGNNSFKFSGKIPRIAPRGNYEVIVWGYNSELGEGPRKKILINLK